MTRTGPRLGLHAPVGTWLTDARAEAIFGAPAQEAVAGIGIRFGIAAREIV
jgi:hypothetical protein